MRSSGSASEPVVLRVVSRIAEVPAADWDACARVPLTHSSRTLFSRPWRRAARPRRDRLAAAASSARGRSRRADRLHALLSEISQPRRVCVRSWLGRRLYARRRPLLSEASGLHPLHPGDGRAPAGQRRRGASRARGDPVAGRGSGHRPARRLLAAHHLPHARGMGARRRARLPPAHRPAIPLAERGLSRASRISSRALASRKRKAIRKERREALGGGIEIEWVTGRDLTEAHWDAFFAFYMDTGSRKWGSPYLTRACFSLLGETMADQILLVLAKRAGRYVAGALNFIGAGRALRPLLGRDRGAPLPAFRGLLLPGHRVRHCRTSSPASRPARKARTSSPAAICRARPIAPITSPIPACAAPSPIISSASGARSRARSRSSPRRSPYRKSSCKALNRAVHVRECNG